MKRTIVIILSFFLLLACDNVNYTSPVPDTTVALKINIVQDAPELTVQGGYKEFTEAPKIGEYVGYGGILVFNDFNDEIVAFDMCCPYEVNKNIRVHGSMLGTATCDSCGTVYNIMYGSGIPESGPSKYALKKYSVSYSGDYIYITN